MSKRIPTSRTDKTREALLRAAGKLFAQNGFSGTSVKDLAESAEVNIALISYHFGGKEGLYRALLEPWVDEKIRFFESFMGPAATKKEFVRELRVFIEHLVDEEINSPELACIMRREGDLGDPVLHEIARKTILPVFMKLAEFFESGQKAGYLRKDLPATGIAVLFIGGIKHALRTDKLRKKIFGETVRDPETREKLVYLTTELFLSGIEARKG